MTVQQERAIELARQINGMLHEKDNQHMPVVVDRTDWLIIAAGLYLFALYDIPEELSIEVKH